MAKRRLSLPEIFNMNFGFLGIQFGWGLQLANMTAIYTKLGAQADDVPFLWLAGPVTGLIVQPIVGALSDRTWNRFGRRRPYFLSGAVLASIALFFMPDSPSIWAAAALLWILDASINVSMEPFRAFVGDKLDAEQRTLGFATQSFFIGVGASLANALPYLFRAAGVEGATASGVPLTVKYAFQLGALVFLLAIVWTFVTTKEEPPDDVEAFREQSRGRSGIVAMFREIVDGVRHMPKTMKQLAVVQTLTWLGLFCMWMFFGLTVARHFFGATNEKSPEFDRGTEWGGVCFAVYSLVTFVVAFALPRLASITNRKAVHAVSLACGGVGLLLVGVFTDPLLLLLSMVGVGIAWASILSMPYAMLASSLPPERMGLYMGIFNFFIVLPEIAAALTFKPLVGTVFGNDPLAVVLLGGTCLLAAAATVFFVHDNSEVTT